MVKDSGSRADARKDLVLGIPAGAGRGGQAEDGGGAGRRLRWRGSGSLMCRSWRGSPSKVSGGKLSGRFFRTTVRALPASTSRPVEAGAAGGDDGCRCSCRRSSSFTCARIFSTSSVTMARAVDGHGRPSSMRSPSVEPDGFLGHGARVRDGRDHILSGTMLNFWPVDGHFSKMLQTVILAMATKQRTGRMDRFSFWNQAIKFKLGDKEIL